ncbi:MAG: hypothetical protein FWF23_05335, partial [Alphaproteobacteria bacterium]|nr:hypothetical protein [Alphaproteobacteria bacterium]
MRRSLTTICTVAATALLVTACESDSIWKMGDSVVQFWRPISEPNILMPPDKLQQKLEFDLSQCHCGIFPTNIPRDTAIQFQKDKQRLVQTSTTVQMDKETETCVQSPALIVTECMRYRGWEPTTCSGRVPVAGG